MSKRLLLALFVLLALGAVIVSAQGSSTAQIRIAHLANDVNEADIYINGALRSIGRERPAYTITSWITVPAGTVQIDVVPAGRSLRSAVVSEAVEVAPDSYTTIAAIGSAFSSGVTAQVIADERPAINENEASLTVFHAIPDGPIVDLLKDGELFLGRLAYPGALTLPGGGTNDGVTTVKMRAGEYNLTLVPNGQSGPVILDLSGTVLEGGMHYFVVAAGTAAAPQVVVASSN